MKRITILLSLISYLCAATYAGELLKIPILFAHFTEHQSDNSTITFYQFIYQHYHDDDGNDQDNDRDEQLPFKSADSSTLSVNSAGIPLYLTNIRFIAFSEHANHSRLNYHQPDITSPYLSRIWQPPKFC